MKKWPAERHKLQFGFIDTGKADGFFNEVTGWLVQWENENEPDEEI